MGRTICPYCDIEVSESSIEAEDGCCPECGAALTVSSLWGSDDDEAFDDDELYEEEEDFDDEDLDDEDLDEHENY